MSDEKFMEYYGYVPTHNEPVSSSRLVFAPVFSVLGVLLFTNGIMCSIVNIILPPLWLVQQDTEKDFYRHHPMWPHIILMAIYGGLWGFTLGYLNNI